MKLLLVCLSIFLTLSAARVGMADPVTTEAPPEAPPVDSSESGPPPELHFDVQDFLDKLNEATSKVKDNLDNLKVALDEVKSNPGEGLKNLVHELVSKEKEAAEAEKKVREELVGALEHLNEDEDHLPNICSGFEDYVFRQLKDGEKPDPKVVHEFIVEDVRCFGDHVDMALKELGHLRKDVEEAMEEGEDVGDVVYDAVVEGLHRLRDTKIAFIGFMKALKEIFPPPQPEGPAPGGPASGGATLNKRLAAILEDLLKKRSQSAKRSFDSQSVKRRFDAVRQYMAKRRQ